MPGLRACRAVAVGASLLAGLAAGPSCEGAREGQACASDGACASGLRCLDLRCAPTLEDPGGLPRAAGGPVRVIALGLHPTIADSVSEGSWERFVRSTFETGVVPRIAEDRDTLVVLPENVLLSAAFIGARGAMAREAPDSTAALGAVLSGAPRAAVYYSERTEATLAPGRVIVLAATDTLWRALEPFRALAREHHLWIAVTGDLAPAHRSTDPRDIEILVDEDAADRSFAWVADGDDVYNQTLIFDPSGELVHAFRKEYLVPIEESESGLALSYGEPGNLGALELPFGRVSSVISKDAWMPDVLDRLALEDVALLMQPEAFSGWGVPEGDDGAWPPDVVAESGWVSLLRDAAPRASVLPCWSGNLFELVFDCQTSVLAHPARDPRPGAWIGRDPRAGFTVIAPWAAEDDRAGTLDQRRVRLRAVGEALAPASGDPRENAYVAGSAVLDLDLDAPMPVRPPDPDEVEVAPSDAGEQRRPALVATGTDTLAVFFEDDRRGATRIYGVLGSVAASGAVTLGEARVRVATVGEPRRVRAAALGDDVHLVWQETRADEAPVVMYARSLDGGRSFRAPVRVGNEAAVGARRFPDVAVGPEGTAWITWVDHRSIAGRVHVGIERDGAVVEIGPVAPSPPPPLATRHAQHLPAISADADAATVVFTEFSEYRWRIARVRCSRLGCGELERLDQAEVAHETIDTDPRIARDVVVWTDLRVRRPDHDVRLRRGASAESASLARSDASGSPQLRPAVTLGPRGDALVVFQDARDGGSTLRLGGVGASGDVRDDEPLLDDDVSRYAPEIVWLEGGAVAAVVVAYETTSSGRRRVGLTVLALFPRR